MLPQSRGAQCSGRLSTLPCMMSVQALRSEEVAAVVMVVEGEERWQKIDCKRWIIQPRRPPFDWVSSVTGENSFHSKTGEAYLPRAPRRPWTPLISGTRQLRHRHAEGQTRSQPQIEMSKGAHWKWEAHMETRVEVKCACLCQSMNSFKYLKRKSDQNISVKCLLSDTPLNLSLPLLTWIAAFFKIKIQSRLKYLLPWAVKMSKKCPCVVWVNIFTRLPSHFLRFFFFLLLFREMKAQKQKRTANPTRQFKGNTCTCNWNIISLCPQSQLRTKWAERLNKSN